METNLEIKIGEYLIDGDRWKMFIAEQLNDLENATLNSGIVVTVHNGKENPFHFDVSFSYKILDDKSSNVDESGKAKYSNKKNTGLKIEWAGPL